MRTKMVISWIFFVVFLGTSKSLFAQTISINIKNATLEETLKKIKQVSGFDMVFKMKDIKDIKKHINLQVEDKDIREVLQSCLQEHDLIFNIYNKTIIIFRKSEQSKDTSVMIHINLWQKLVLDWKKVNLERYLTKMENLYSGFRLEINPA